MKQKTVTFKEEDLFSTLGSRKSSRNMGEYATASTEEGKRRDSQPSTSNSSQDESTPTNDSKRKVGHRTAGSIMMKNLSTKPPVGLSKTKSDK